MIGDAASKRSTELRSVAAAPETTRAASPVIRTARPGKGSQTAVANAGEVRDSKGRLQQRAPAAAADRGNAAWTRVRGVVG